MFDAIQAETATVVDFVGYFAHSNFVWTFESWNHLEALATVVCNYKSEEH